jgi:hypothetical protein
MKIGIADFECKGVKIAKTGIEFNVHRRRVFGCFALIFLLKLVSKTLSSFWDY